MSFRIPLYSCRRRYRRWRERSPEAGSAPAYGSASRYQRLVTVSAMKRPNGSELLGS